MSVTDAGMHPPLQDDGREERHKRAVGGPEIGVVIPVYRSQAIVPRLCDALKTALASCEFEIVLVNDCSPDDSWAAICREGEADRHIRGVNLRRNVGQDRAIMAGLSHTSSAYTVVMDDDLQHSPADIQALYDRIRQGFDVCYANFAVKKQTRLKNFGSWMAGKVAELLLGKPPGLYMSPFKIMRREIVEEILRYRGPFPYVDGLILQITTNITQITVEHHERHSGRSTHNVWKQAHVFLNLATNFSVLPLRLMTVSGLVCSSTALVLGLYFLTVYFTNGIPVYGWTALMLVNLFFGGMVLMSLGLLGEYLGRVLMNVNQTPQFVVKELLNDTRPSGEAS